MQGPGGPSMYRSHLHRTTIQVVVFTTEMYRTKPVTFVVLCKLFLKLVNEYVINSSC